MKQWAAIRCLSVALSRHLLLSAACMDDLKPTVTDGLSRYQHRPLRGNDIRLIELQPGRFKDSLHAKIVHCPFETATASSQQHVLRTAEIDKTLSQGWRSFRTPEGRILYSNLRDDSPASWHHPFPETLPEDIKRALQIESDAAEHHSAVNSSQQFEALSYVWGDPVHGDDLFLADGLETIDYFYIPITSNLGCALRHLRSEYQTQVLWIDAVCINQHDVSERNAQVTRIGEIFTSAWRVTAWLGEASNDSKLAMRTLQYLGAQIEITQDRWYHPAPSADEPWSHTLYKLPYGETEWASLHALLDRPWFHRLWVLQEICFANARAVVQCGYTTMLYYHLRRAVFALNIRSGVPDSVKTRTAAITYLSHGPRNLSVHDLINLARTHACSVPHDKIYGLLSFFGPGFRKNVEPSYEASIYHVFRGVFLAYSNLTGRSELLANSRLSKESNWPSWVPDWRSYGNRISHRGTEGYYAAGFSLTCFEEPSPGVLDIAGVIYDVVTSVFEVPRSQNTNDIRMWMRKLFERYRKLSGDSNDNNVEQYFAKSMCDNQLRERYPDVTDYPRLEAWRKTLTAAMYWKKFQPRNERLEEAEFSRRLGFWTTRRMCNTKKGLLGSGPVDVQEGDYVCVILGLHCPLLIRSVGDDRYCVVGGCYVQGLMDCEALLGQVPEGVIVQRIDVDGRDQRRFLNTSTGEATVEDPRLGALPRQWKRVDRETTADDPEQCEFFENTETGDIINYDPRMSVSVLKERGVGLEKVRLV